MYDYLDFNILKGKELQSVRRKGDDEIIFEVSEKEKYMLFHYQDCCENVYIDDICGDLKDLVGPPVLLAEETSNSGENDDSSFTWTFYRIGTIKGDVTIRWYGESNGYYSESVELARINKSGGQWEPAPSQEDRFYILLNDAHDNMKDVDFKGFPEIDLDRYYSQVNKGLGPNRIGYKECLRRKNA